MYTTGMTNQQPTDNLASFLRRWRGQRGISEVTRAAGMSQPSIWSKLEKGQAPSLETLVLLSQHTGRAVDELAVLAGLDVRRSASARDQADRVAAMVQAIPRTSVLVDLLVELTPGEVDTLLTIAEGMIRGRRGP